MDDKLRILLCEDDENLGMLLREFLMAKGYNVDLMPDGDKGYKAFLKGKYDLCVLDVMMPKINGYKICRLLKFDNKYKTTGLQELQETPRTLSRINI